MRQSSFAWLFHLGVYPLARWRVGQWERDPAHRDQMEHMAEAARRNVALPPGFDPRQQERFVAQAAHRYRIYWEALQLSHLTRGRQRLIAMYLDGSQHHIRQPVALHLTTVDKGQVTQPWQGEGALRDNGHGRLEPYVLTTGRRERSVVRTVAGLDLVPSARVRADRGDLAQRALPDRVRRFPLGGDLRKLTLPRDASGP